MMERRDMKIANFPNHRGKFARNSWRRVISRGDTIDQRVKSGGCLA